MAASQVVERWPVVRSPGDEKVHRKSEKDHPAGQWVVNDKAWEGHSVRSSDVRHLDGWGLPNGDERPIVESVESL